MTTDRPPIPPRLYTLVAKTRAALSDRAMRRRVARVAAAALLAVVALNLIVPKPPLMGYGGSSQAVYDRDGNLLRLTLAPDERYRLWTPLDRISPLLIEATLLQEDRYFYFHGGVNPVSLARAAWDTYITRQRRLGASTLSMQLARLRFQLYTRDVRGKLVQILRALQLEWHYSKDEILEAYFNLAPYGGNIEGAGTASLIFFNKTPDRLTLPEALTLAVIPQDPAGRTPARENPELLSQRERLFDAWVQRNPHAEAQRELMRLNLAARGRSTLPFHAPHLVDTTLRAHPGRREIYTTIDLRTQALLERHARAFVARNKSHGIRNVSALLVDSRDMGVRALLGSVDFFDDAIEGQVNGTEAKRSPGSALKPFIYALAIDQGLIHPLTMLKDAPTRIGAYNPENFDHEFVGPIKTWEALVKSRNVPALTTAARLKNPSFYEFLQRARIRELLGEDHYGLALVLGGGEVTMIELARLYAMLINSGVLKPLRMLRDDVEQDWTQLLSPEASYLTLEMLKTNPRPDQAYRDDWLRAPMPVYWKTGTSYGFRDAWSIAVFGPYVVAVWAGNFSGEGDPALIGRQAAAPLMFSIIDALRASATEIPPTFPQTPSGLAKVEVCALSGHLPNPDCTHRTETWFVPGKSPITLCPIHRRIYVSQSSGKRACGPGAGVISEVFEVWPSDLAALFREAGIPRRSPPPANAACTFVQHANAGAPPDISSPGYGLEYRLHAERIGRETIPLTAVVDGGSRRLFWFVNERFLGWSTPDRPLFWAPAPGDYVIRAVDDRGLSTAREVKVALTGS